MARGYKRKVVKRSAAKEYAGLLAQPMFPLHALSTDSDRRVWVMKRALKTALLFRHFDTNPNGKDAWQNLAIALAERHVPGFNPPRNKQGRPRERANDDLTLLLLVELLKRRDGVSDRAAIKRRVPKRIAKASERCAGLADAPCAPKAHQRPRASQRDPFKIRSNLI
jgi:hypothetical protein